MPTIRAVQQNLATATAGLAWRTVSTAHVIANPSTGITINKPSGVVTDDVLYAFIFKGEAVSLNQFTCAGWTVLLNSGTATDQDRQLTILRKVITNGGTEPSSYLFTVPGNNNAAAITAIIVRLSGVDLTTPEDVTVTLSHRVLGSNDATPLSVDVTSVTNDALVLQFCGLNLGTTALKTWGPPAGYTQDSTAIVAEPASSLNDLQAGVAFKRQTTAGAVGTNVWTHTPNDATTEYMVAVVVVRPAVIVTAPTAIYARIDGVWVPTTGVHVHHEGDWADVTHVYVRQSGAWVMVQ